MELLEGPVIDVLVGERNAFALKSRTWYLPRSAWAHFSPTLETLCSNVDSDPVKKRIGLPGRNPTVFAMFVEWMFKGQYDDSICAQQFPDSNPHAKAWLLGDWLQCIDFQNYAMNRLYTFYIVEKKVQLVRPEIIREVHDGTVCRVDLQMFYLDFTATNFNNATLVSGSALEWDQLFQLTPAVRMYILTAFKEVSATYSRVRSKELYLIAKEDMPSFVHPLKQTGVLTPAKRAADGESVQKDATNALSGDAIPDKNGESRKMAKIGQDRAPDSVVSAAIVKQEATDT